MARTGRPTELDQIVRTRPDGTQLTAGEQVIDRIQLGLDYQSAADSAGISRQTLHTWRVTGARHRATEVRGGKITKAERRYVDFLDAMERAESEAEGNRLAIIAKVAQGGAQVVKVTEKVLASGETETTTVTETLRPEWTAAAWFLERRLSDKYAKRYELTGAEGDPLIGAQDQAAALAESLRAYQQGLADAEQIATEKT